MPRSFGAVAAFAVLLLLTSCENIHATSTPSSVIELQDWILAKGGQVSENIVVTNKADGGKIRQDGGRGVFAVKALEKGHILLRLPLHLVLDKHVALAAAAPGTHPVDALALFILGEKEKGESSEWKTYIDTLPSSVPGSPLFIGTDVLNARIMPVLPDLAEEVLAFQETIDERYVELSHEGWKDKVPSLTKDTLRWAVAVVLGRLFGVMHKNQNSDGKGEWTKVHGLVPFADLFNTNFPPSALNADCRTDTTSTYFECFTTQDVDTGTEVWMPYIGADNPDRPVDNLHLWVNYGFVVQPMQGQQRFKDEQALYNVVKPLVEQAEKDECASEL